MSNQKRLSVIQALMFVLFGRGEDDVFKRMEPRNIDVGEDNPYYGNGAQCLFEGTGPNCIRIFITEINAEEYLGLEKIEFDPDTEEFKAATPLGFIKLGKHSNDAMNFVHYVESVEALSRTMTHLW